jgi:hypothetical protein
LFLPRSPSRGPKQTSNLKLGSGQAAGLVFLLVSTAAGPVFRGLAHLMCYQANLPLLVIHYRH